MHAGEPHLFVFGPYEFDPVAMELRKFGLKVRVQVIPLRVLEALLEFPGELVSREELRKRIWSDDTFVDFEHGLNTAVAKLRQALSDSAADPKFIETLERRGYRFIGGVEAKARPLPRRIVPIAAAAAAAAAPAPAPALDPPLPEAVPITASPSLSFGDRRRLRFTVLALVAFVLISAIVLAIYLFSSRTLGRVNVPPIRSIAVLPFKNVSNAPGDEAFADAVTDGVVTTLAQIGSIRVISTTSTMSYKGTNKRLPEIARELKVDGVIEGTVIREGGKVRITVQLIHAPSDQHLWVEEYDRELKEVLAVQREVARSVAREIRVLLTPADERIFAVPRAVMPGAHEAYVQGRSHWFRRWLGGRQDLEVAGQYFSQSIGIDPDYAPAHAGLADYHAFRAVYGVTPPIESWPRAEQAIQRALQLDPTLAEAHISLAASRLYWHWDLEGALAASSEAMKLNPNYSEAHSFRSTLFAILGRFDESLDSARRAEDLDPVGQKGRYLLALYRARRYRDIEREAQRRLADDPALAQGFFARAYLGQGKLAEAYGARLRHLQLTGDTLRLEAYPLAWKADGFRGIWKWELRQVQDRAAREYVSPFTLAEAHARVGNRNETIRYLKACMEEHSDRLVFLYENDAFDPFHDDPTFRQIVTRLNLPKPNY